MMVQSSYGCILTLFISIIFFFFVSYTKSSLLRDVSPRDYQRGHPLEVFVNKLSSTKTQFPYDYYYLKHLKPKEIHDALRNLGEVLRGDHIQSSVYTVFYMREELACKVSNRIRLDAESANNFKEMIDDKYRVNMLLDNLPVTVLRQSRFESPSTSYVQGFPVGFKGTYPGTNDEKYFINNHLSFRVMYHKDHQNNFGQIVGFEVVPSSINHEYKGWREKNSRLTICNRNTKNEDLGWTLLQEVDTNKEVLFTYDVTFKESEIEWASRWDAYNLANDDQLSWFSIVNSLMMVLLKSCA